MIDAAFDHLFSDPQPSQDTSLVAPAAEPQTADQLLSHEPATEDLGGNPVYDTGS